MQQKARVLFVDDERRVLNSVRGMFRREFDLFLAADGETAVEIASQNHIDVIVADQRMPGMSGTDVLGKVKQLSPDTIRILLTGYADPEAVESSINVGEVFRFLGKPCPPKVLRETLGVAIKAARSGREKPARLSSESDSSRTAVPKPYPATEPIASQATKRQYEVRPETRVKNVGTVLYTRDANFAESSLRAISAERRTTLATSLVKVIQELRHESNGMLLTDVSDNDAQLQGIISTLKVYVPELVTLVVSDNRDSTEMINLINCGQIFRYLSKPVPPTRLRSELNAAATKHLALCDNRESTDRHVVSQHPANRDIYVMHTDSLNQMQRARQQQLQASSS